MWNAASCDSAMTAGLDSGSALTERTSYPSVKSTARSRFAQIVTCSGESSQPQLPLVGDPDIGDQQADGR